MKLFGKTIFAVRPPGIQPAAIKDHGEHFPYLDFFRGLAIIWVVLHHGYVFFIREYYLGAYNNVARRFFMAGSIGVDMFFVISGFLITGLLIKDLDQGISLSRFYKRRFFKIVPSYVLILVAGFVLNAIFNFSRPMAEAGLYYNSRGNFFVHLLFFQNYAIALNDLAHTWSLCVEEHFYLFFAIILSMIWHFGRTPDERRSLTVWVACGIILFCIGLRYVDYTGGYKYLLFSSQWPEQTTLFRLDALMVGSLLRIFEPQLSKVAGKKEKAEMSFCLFLGLLIYFLIIRFQAGISLEWYYIQLSYFAPACLLIAAVGGINGYCSNWIIRFIGKNSYGIYLWHYPVAFPMLFLKNHLPVMVNIGIYFLVAFALGILSTQSVEAYFLRMRDRVAP